MTEEMKRLRELLLDRAEDDAEGNFVLRLNCGEYQELVDLLAERHYRAALETEECPTCQRVMKWQAIVCTDLNHSSPAPVPRWNTGRCSNDMRLHLENENHICHNWRAEPAPQKEKCDSCGGSRLVLNPKWITHNNVYKRFITCPDCKAEPAPAVTSEVSPYDLAGIHKMARFRKDTK